MIAPKTNRLVSLRFALKQALARERDSDTTDDEVREQLELAMEYIRRDKEGKSSA